MSEDPAPPFILNVTRPIDGGSAYYFQLEAKKDDSNPLRPPTDLENMLVDKINAAVRALPIEADGNAGSRAKEQWAANNETYAKDLASIATNFINGSSVFDSLLAFGIYSGRWAAKHEAIGKAAQRGPRFLYDGDPSVPVDLDIKLGDSILGEDQVKLVVEVRKALSVISVVFSKPGSDRPRLGAYVQKLYDIVEAGLGSELGATVALHSLEAFEDEFVSREATGVKNQHIKVLGHRVLQGCSTLTPM